MKDNCSPFLYFHAEEGNMSSDDKEFLGKEPVGKLLFRLALPTVAAQLINML